MIRYQFYHFVYQLQASQSQIVIINIDRLKQMQEVLIYDIESQERSSENAEESKEEHHFKHLQKDTQNSEIISTKTIKVNSQTTEDSCQKKQKNPLNFQDNIIFYEEDLDQSTSSVDYDDTKRGFLKKQHLQSSDEDLQQQYQDQVQDLENMNQIQQSIQSKRNAIIPQQKRLENKSVLIRANKDLLVKQIVPLGFKLTCILKIQRNFMGIASVFRLFLNQKKQFLLSAKKQIFKVSSSYIISKNPNQIHKRSDVFVGKLNANFIGTEFHFYSVKDQFQSLKLVMTYEKNIVGFNGPRKFSVVKVNPKIKGGVINNLHGVLERNEKSKLIELSTAEPILKKGKFRLDFQRKVKFPSSKNFILQRNDQTLSQIKTNCLMFCKVEEDAFLLEISYPLSVFQAFGICLSSLDSKLMVN